jgi:aromatic-L-amino-acid decarboxylase
MDRTTRLGRVMITGAVAGGRYLGRVCVLSFRTHAPQVDALVADLSASIDAIVTEFANR